MTTLYSMFRLLEAPPAPRRNRVRLGPPSARVRATLLVSAVMAVGTPLEAHAAVITVREDGTGDYATVWQALEATADGDEVVVFPGFYDERTDEGAVRQVFLRDGAVTLRGMTADPSAVVITYLQTFVLDGARIENLTISETPLSPVIVGALAGHGPVSLVVSNCAFLRNQGDAGGGAIDAYGDYAENLSVLVDRCTFEDNQVTEGGGAILCTANLTVRNSTFIRNRSGNDGGCIHTGGHLIVEGCLFWENESVDHGAAIHVGGGHSIRNSTFWGNSGRSTLATGGPSEWMDAEIRNCIIGRTHDGYGILCESWFEITCCTLSFNDRFHYGWCEPPAGSGVVYDVDPEFCDEAKGDFRLKPGSPCLPGFQDGMDCDLIGAYGIGCGATPVVDTSWGQLKRRFR